MSFEKISPSVKSSTADLGKVFTNVYHPYLGFFGGLGVTRDISGSNSGPTYRLVALESEPHLISSYFIMQPMYAHVTPKIGYLITHHFCVKPVEPIFKHTMRESYVINRH